MPEGIRVLAGTGHDDLAALVRPAVTARHDVAVMISAGPALNIAEAVQ